MYGILASIVDIIHIVVIVFILWGILIKRTSRLKIFHDYFCIMVFILQIICGFKCPLVILSDQLRHLENPEYEIAFTPFTEKLFMKLFGISISSNLVFIVIALLAVVGITHLLTVRKLKKDKNRIQLHLHCFKLKYVKRPVPIMGPTFFLFI